MKISVNLSEFFEKEIQEISRGDERILETNRLLFSQIETVEEMYILIAILAFGVLEDAELLGDLLGARDAGRKVAVARGVLLDGG